MLYSIRGGCSSDSSSGGGEAEVSLTGVSISGTVSIEATESTALTATPAFSGDADSSAESSVAYKWEIKSGTEYAKIASGADKATATITGTNTTGSEQQATVLVTATYNGVQNSTSKTITIAAASSENPDNPDDPVTPDNPDTPSTQTKITITYITEHGTAPDAKTVELTDSLYTLTSDNLPELVAKGYIFGGWSKTEVVEPVETTATVQAGDTITQDTTLYAVWTPITYTVRFDANGGSGEAIPEISATYDVSFEIPENTFTREGYSASSNNTWNKKEDGSGTYYSAGQKRKNLSAINGKIVTLYAIWVENGSHTIAYLDTDGSTIDGMSLLTFKETDDVDLTGVIPSKAGYTFAGWVVSTGSATPDTGSATTITGWKAGEKTSDVTLYAVWTANTDTKYTVKHLLENVALDGYEEQTDDAQTLTGTTGAETSAEAKTYAGFTAQTITQGTIVGDGSTVVCVYYDRNTVTLTFDTDGGSEIAPITGKYGTAVTAPEAPTKEGYTFAAWSPSIPETFPAVNETCKATWTENKTEPATASYTVKHCLQNVALDGYEEQTDDAQTLTGTTGETTSAEAKTYAGFTAQTITQGTIMGDGSTVVCVYYDRNTVTLTFDTDGGSEIAPITGKYGTAVTAPEAPTKKGYTFAAWSPSIPETFPAENETCKATWTPITYTVRFDANGGSGETIQDISATYDVSFEIPENTFTREGYSASSNNTWNKKEDGSGTSFIAGQKRKNLTSIDDKIVTLYAIWVENGSHTIAYLDTDGSAIDGMSLLTFKETDDVDLTGVIPSKAGYTFAGWVVSTGSATTVTGWKAGEKTSDVTLYAVWTANTYTVTFNANGGSGNDTTQVFTYGISATLNTNSFSRTGYSFAGWSEDSDSESADYSDGAEYTILASDTTLYAVWQPNRAGISAREPPLYSEKYLSITEYETSDTSITFTIDTEDEISSCAWYVDGKKMSSEKLFTMNYADYKVGSHTLMLVVGKSSATVEVMVSK